MAGLSGGVAVRPDLEALSGYHSPQVDVAVRLNTNESPFPPPAAWVDALQEEIASLAWHRYPDRGARALRAALAEHHGVAPEQVFCANGSNEVIQCLLLAYGGADRRVAVFEPTYALHSHIARLTATGVVAASRRPDFSLDPAVVLRVLARERPEVTFVCSPNNPTGGAAPPELVEEVVEEAPGLVAVDEAYGQFCPWTALSLLREGSAGAERLVVIRTFSKTWSMAGARLGYLVGPPSVVEALDSVALPYHLDSVKQAAGRLALRHEHEMRERVEAVVAEREVVAAALGRLGMQVWPSQANFILFRPPDGRGHEVWQGLLDRSVLVRDCSSWAGLAGCLRVTVGTAEENARFLEALAEVDQ